MIRLNGKYDIPTEWEECSPEQYLSVMSVMSDFLAGRCGFTGMRVRLVMALTGLSEADSGNAVLAENIYRLSERITFPFRYHYAEERYGKLSPEMQEKLRKHLPEELDADEPEVRIAQQFRPTVGIDLSFTRQMLPELPSGQRGYEFRRRGRLVDTSLTAAQYIDANSMLSIARSEDEDRDMALDSLVAVLYAPRPYDPDSCDVSWTADVPQEVKNAVMYNYVSIIGWISGMPEYDILFHTPGPRRRSILGADASLMTLAEKGYGDWKAVGRMNVFAYLDALLKQTVDAVNEMAAYKVKKTEIADKMNMTLEQVISVLK